MINVVDARMGIGKTSAAIQYMNDHPDKRYLFITPFIEETKRICDACSELGFWTPNNTLSEHKFRKANHLRSLVETGRNVALTHSLFKMCDNETVRMITERGYVIFIDEVIDVFDPLAISPSDIEILTGSGWFRVSGSDEAGRVCSYELNPEKEYSGGAFSEVFTVARNNQLVSIRDCARGGEKLKLYFWALHKDLLALADEAYVLTYMFDGMPMKAMLEIYGIEYRYIGVRMDDEGKYRFTDEPVADRAPELRQLLHICDNERLNRIGDKPTALSASWYNTAAVNLEDGRLDTVRKNLNNFFRNYVPEEIGSSGRLWCTFKNAVGKVRDNGFYRSNLAWNARATNDYQDKSALAYCVNVYMNPSITIYFKENGVSIDPDKYALANMVQWLWRGCIRRGEEMWVYVPSSRMRGLLVDWLDELAGEKKTRGDEECNRKTSERARVIASINAIAASGRKPVSIIRRAATTRRKTSMSC